MAVSGVVGAIYKASGTKTDFTDEPLTHEAGSGNTRYYITDRTKAYWDNETPVLIESSPDGTTWTPVASGYEIEHAGGYVDFSADQTTLQFRATGKHFTPVSIGGGFNWTLDVELENFEATTYLNNGWRSFVAGIRGFSGSFENYWLNGDNVADIGNLNLIIVLYTDVTDSKARYEGYATMLTNSITTPNDDLVTESVDFQGGGKIYYREG